MKINMFVSTLVTAILLLSGNFVFADGDQPWHVSYQIGGVDLNSDRHTRDGDLWQSVGFGYFFNDHFSVDIEYDEFDGDFTDFDTVVPGATYDQWKLSTLGAVGRFYFGDNAWKPYVLGGVGSTKHRNVMDEGHALSLSLGVGLHGQLSRHLSGRAQAMWRQDYDSASFGPQDYFRDFIYSIGLNFDFGGRTAAATQPPPPAAPPPAAAAPPPANPDLDGDGVPNERDKCPNTRPGAVVDMDGCEVEAVISLEGVHFDFDKSTLRPEAMVILDNAAGLLTTHERVVVEVAGHTDSVGTEEYNQKLSERRANSVQDYLVSKGIKASRLSARGYGEVQPVATNDTAEGRQANRRVELIILDR